MKNLLIAVLSVAVIVLAFLLWKASCKPEKESFGFTEEYLKYLEGFNYSEAFTIDPEIGKEIVKSNVDSLYMYRKQRMLKNEIERYIYFPVPLIDSILLKIDDVEIRKNSKLRIYLGHYGDNEKIKKYLEKNVGKDNINYYLNRNTVILQLVDNNDDSKAALNVGSICPPKCSSQKDDFKPY